MKKIGLIIALVLMVLAASFKDTFISDKVETVETEYVTVVSDSVIHATDSMFREMVVPGSGLVVVDFYADWCSPCVYLSPIMEDIASLYEGEVTFLKIDIDYEREVALENGIEWIPALLFFKDGEFVYYYDGASILEDIAVKVDSLK